MTNVEPVYVIDYLNAADRDEDNLITDISRGPDSIKNQQQLEKWKQKLRIELIREQYEAREKQKAQDKPILLKLLNIGKTC